MKVFKKVIKIISIGIISIIGLFMLYLFLFEKDHPKIESKFTEEYQLYKFVDTEKMRRASKFAIDASSKQNDKFPQIKGIELILKNDEFTQIDSIYIRNKLYLVNNTESKLCLDAQDSRLNIIMQAKNIIGNWQNIEYAENSWCGNSYRTICLNKNEFWRFSSPIFKGRHKTKLRYKLEMKDKDIVSNEIDGYVNIGQFLNKEKDFPDFLNLHKELTQQLY